MHVHFHTRLLRATFTPCKQQLRSLEKLVASVQVCCIVLLCTNCDRNTSRRRRRHRRRPKRVSASHAASAQPATLASVKLVHVATAGRVVGAGVPCSWHSTWGWPRSVSEWAALCVPGWVWAVAAVCAAPVAPHHRVVVAVTRGVCTQVPTACDGRWRLSTSATRN